MLKVFLCLHPFVKNTFKHAEVLVYGLIDQNSISVPDFFLHDRRENPCTASTSLCPIKSLRKVS